MFLVVSRLDEHFGFDQPFFACLIEKSAPRIKFVHPWKSFFFQRCILNRQTSNKQLLGKTSWLINGWLLNTPQYFEMYGNSCSQMFYKIGVLKIFTGQNLCWSLFFVDFIQKKLQHRCFPVDIANF